MDYKEDTLRIILSPILGILDQFSWFYRPLRKGKLGFEANFLALHQNSMPFILGKNYGSVFDHKDYARGIILSLISGRLYDTNFPLYKALSDSTLCSGAIFLALCKKSRPFTPLFWEKEILGTSLITKRML